MSKIDKKFNMLFAEEELENVKAEAAKRNLSTSEFIRMCIKNEITKKSNYLRIVAVRNLASLKSE